jgi:Flp pilus assembly protein TadD
LRWHTPEYQDTLGWAYYKLGQLDRAIRPLRLAEQFGPYDPIFPAHLGEVYEAQGRLADARAAYRRALELDPTCDEAQRGLRFLECDD